MTDQAKRKTLKTMAVGGMSLAAGGVGTMAMASSEKLVDDKYSAELAELTVKISHSWSAHDVKVLVKNETRQPVTITQMTPSRISTQMGDLDFDRFMQNGPVTLMPGTEIAIEMDNRKAAKAYGTQSGQAAKTLQQTIRQNLSIVTDHQAYAAVTMQFDPCIV